MASRDEIIAQALTLSSDDRAYVAEAIEQSLSRDGFATPEIAQAWLQEVERRAEAYDRGEMRADDWRTVIARLRSQFASSAGSS